MVRMVSVTWFYDTCSCVVEYEFDDDLPDNERTFIPKSTKRRCTAHTTLALVGDLFNVLKDENPRKNDALQVALANGPTTLYDIINGIRVLKPTITYNYSFTGVSPLRVLNISFTGVTLTNAQRTTMQTAMNTRFGTGKVTVG